MATTEDGEQAGCTGLPVNGAGFYVHTAFATGLGQSPQASAGTLYQLVLNGDGAEAVRELAQLAFVRGCWTPAPDDALVYDAGLGSNV